MMDDEDFNGIIAGLGDAIDYAKGDHARGRAANVDIEAMRAAATLSQAKFASTYQFPPRTVRD